MFVTENQPGIVIADERKRSQDGRDSNITHSGSRMGQDEGPGSSNDLGKRLEIKEKKRKRKKSTLTTENDVPRVPALCRWSPRELRVLDRA